MRRLYRKSNPNPSHIKTYRYLANRFPRSMLPGQKKSTLPLLGTVREQSPLSATVLPNLQCPPKPPYLRELSFDGLQVSGAINSNDHGHIAIVPSILFPSSIRDRTLRVEQRQKTPRTATKISPSPTPPRHQRCWFFSYLASRLAPNTQGQGRRPSLGSLVEKKCLVLLPFSEDSVLD